MQLAITSSTTPIKRWPPRFQRDTNISASLVAQVVTQLADDLGISPTMLARQTGACERRMYAVINGKQRTCRRSFLDLILTRTGNQHLWHEQPLRDAFVDDADGGLR